MVAGKQAEVGILEAPVIMCHKENLPGIETLRIVTSLGPLPPYRIMVNNALPGKKILFEGTTKIFGNVSLFYSFYHLRHISNIFFFLFIFSLFYLFIFIFLSFLQMIL